MVCTTGSTGTSTSDLRGDQKWQVLSAQFDLKIYGTKSDFKTPQISFQKTWNIEYEGDFTESCAYFGYPRHFHLNKKV
jgi:hypothetical protein